MKLSEKQIEFLLGFFPETCCGAKEIATKLLIKGKCIIAGTKDIWTGGVGNYIKSTPLEDSYQCTELTFDLYMFLSSNWVQDVAEKHKSRIRNKIRELEVESTEISALFK